MPEEKPDSQPAVKGGERVSKAAKLEAEGETWGEEQYRRQWEAEQKSPEYKEATELADQLQQLLAKRALTLQGQLVPGEAYEAAELLMRAVGDLLEHPIEISTHPELEALKQQEEPTGSRRYFVNRVAGALGRLGLPGSALEKNAKEKGLV